MSAGYGGSIVATQISSSCGGSVAASLALSARGLATVSGQTPIATYSPTAGVTVNGIDVYADFYLNSVVTINGPTTLTFSFPAGMITNRSYYYAVWYGNCSGANCWIDQLTGPFPVTTINPLANTVTIVGTPGAAFQPNTLYGFVIYH